MNLEANETERILFLYVSPPSSTILVRPVNLWATATAPTTHFLCCLDRARSLFLVLRARRPLIAITSYQLPLLFLISSFLSPLIATHWTIRSTGIPEILITYRHLSDMVITGFMLTFFIQGRFDNFVPYEIEFFINYKGMLLYPF